jgi:hypothetical protein
MRSSRLTVLLAATAVAVAAAVLVAPPADAAYNATLKPNKTSVSIGATVKFTYSGPSRATGELYRSTNGGKTWTLVKALGAHARGTIAVRPATSGSVVYAATWARAGHKVAESKHVTIKVVVPVTLSLGITTPQVDVGAGPAFTYSTTAGPSGVVVQLQRQFGTAKSWQSVATVAAGANLATTAPVLSQMGKYVYRLAAVKGTTIQAISPSAVAYAYSGVPLYQLCGRCGGTVVVGGKVFSYTDLLDDTPFGTETIYPAWQQHEFFDTKGTSCRSLTVQFASSSQGPADTVYVQVVQTASDPVVASTPQGAVGSVTVKLDGGPVYVNGSGTTGYDEDIAVAITGSCYSATGQP